MLKLFNKIFVHKDSFYKHPENGDLSECVQSNYFTENDNCIDSYENALISISERVTRHIGIFSNLKMLIIADLHGHFRNYERELENISETDYDICLLLGDNTKPDLKNVLKYVSLDKIIGVLGNHDERYYYDMFGITNIAGKIVECKGVKFTGIEGCVAYKTNMPGFKSQEDSLFFAEKLPAASILISHSNPFLSGYTDDIHDGLMGVTKYLYKNQVSLCIHGHIHENKIYTLQNGTTVLSCYGIQLVTLKNVVKE